MRLFDAIHRNCPSDGFYLSIARSALGWLEAGTSLNKAFRRWSKRRYPNDSGKSPKWTSELYQSAWLAFGVFLVLLDMATTGLDRWIGASLVFLAAYRLYEITVFSLHWILERETRIYSFQRSLIGFLFNIFEIAAFTTFARNVIDADRNGLEVLAQIRHGIAAVLTLDSGDSASLAGSAIDTVRLAMSAVLILIVMSNLVGGITREALHPKGAA